MPTVAGVEIASEALTPQRLHPLRRRLGPRSSDLADLIAHAAALQDGDFKRWPAVKRDLHALHGARRPMRAKIY